METNVSKNLQALFSELENFVSTKSVVGEPIEMGDVKILPLVDVSFGVAAGATDSKKTDSNGMGGLGAKVSPIAFLVVDSKGKVEIVHMNSEDSMKKLVEMVPGLIDKLVKKKKANAKAEVKEEN